MARYDIYANPEASERKHTPYFLDIQNDHIEGLSTRVVIPLRRETVFGPRARNLNPLLLVSDDAVVLDTAALGAVPIVELRRPIANVQAQSTDILEALDTLFGAY